MAKDKHGICPLCKRETTLTFHHLIPKMMHRRTYFKKNFSSEERNQGVDVCRKCHSGIHDLYSEMHLAKYLNTLEKLEADEAVAKHCSWVAKLK